MTINIPDPSPKQDEFLRATERYVGYGGARGGGKSWAVQVKAVLLALKWAGIKILIVRKSYPELIRNHVEPIKKLLPRSVVKYNKTDKQFVFANGSTISLGYCATDSDLDQYQGAEYDVIFFDEATQLKEEWLTKINLTVRGTNGFPKRTYYTCNPGGVSHGYIKRLFIDRIYKEGEKPENYRFIKALVTDNHALMRIQPEYLDMLDSLSPKLRAAWRDGRWDVFEGQFFEEFTDDPEHYGDGMWTHVITPFEVPSNWPVYRSYDFGYAKPFSCGWWTVNPDGTVYRIAELYGCTGEPNEGLHWDPDKQFKAIADFEKQEPNLRGRRILGIADPSIWDASRGEAIITAAERHGIFFSPGDNARIAGWMQMHYRFAFDANGRPMMYIFNTCRDFVRTIPLMSYNETNTKAEDLDTTLEDHIADETRYFLMSRPVKPRYSTKAPQLRFIADPLNQLYTER